jgi:hypothetical protein
MTGPVPVARPPACQDTDNDLDDERPMDEDECLDYADQEPPYFNWRAGTDHPGALSRVMILVKIYSQLRWTLV